LQYAYSVTVFMRLLLSDAFIIDVDLGAGC